MIEDGRFLWETPGGMTHALFKNMLQMPHILVAGETGCGKSVAINGMIATLLYRGPGDGEDRAEFILIDPKSVELEQYKDLPHTIAYAEGFNPSAWVSALRKAVSIMERRKETMKKRREKMYTGSDLYVIIDEWATVYKNGGKEAYNLLMRLTCEGRAMRVHAIVATQTPKSTVIPTDVRNNFNARLCMRTVDATASRVILGMSGCETLPFPADVGYASGYYYHGGKIDFKQKLPYVQQDEIDRLVNWWLEQKEQLDQFNASHGRAAAPGRKRSFTDRVFDWFGIQTYPV